MAAASAVEALMCLFRQQEKALTEALSEEHSRQRACLTAWLERGEAAPGKEFGRAVSGETAATGISDIDVEEVAQDDRPQHPLHFDIGDDAPDGLQEAGDEEEEEKNQDVLPQSLINGAEQAIIGEEMAASAPDVIQYSDAVSGHSDVLQESHGLHSGGGCQYNQVIGAERGDTEYTHQQSSAEIVDLAGTAHDARRGGCENRECERGDRCDQLTSEGHQIGCLRLQPPPGGAGGGCGHSGALSHSSSGGRSCSPSPSSAARGRKRRSPEDELAYEDDVSEDMDLPGSRTRSDTWSDVLTSIECEMAYHGLAHATAMACEAIGAEFLEAPPEQSDDGGEWVAEARLVDEHTKAEIYRAAGTHVERRPARRAAYCMILNYVLHRIGAYMLQAFQETADSPGLRQHDLDEHLQRRFGALLERAACGSACR